MLNDTVISTDSFMQSVYIFVTLYLLRTAQYGNDILDLIRIWCEQKHQIATIYVLRRPWQIYSPRNFQIYSVVLYYITRCCCSLVSLMFFLRSKQGQFFAIMIILYNINSVRA